jgi:pimeloyl-ACP methyl ester carboxylesterase
MVQRSLVFIHGRYADQGDWVGSINTGLVAAGWDTLPADVDIVEVDYSDVLHDVLASMPERAMEASEPAAGFARHQRMVRLSMHPFTIRPMSPYDFFPKEWVTRFLMSRMPEIQRYRAQPEVRAAVRARCMEQLPKGDLMIIGHSLGAVVAFDLMHYLPKDTHVELLLTIGSPMARRPWRDTLAEFRGQFPTGVVTTWVNLVNKGDWVTAGDGIHLWYPQAIDTFASLGLGLHGETHYLASEPAGMAIGDALVRAQARAHP